MTYTTQERFLRKTNDERATEHFSSTGEDHTFIDQDVTKGTSPDFAGITRDDEDFTVDCGTAKTLVLAETVYNDIQFPISSGKVPPSNFPDFDAFTTNTNAFSFDVGDYIDLQSNELSHDWKEGTTGIFHVHFATAGANATGSSQYAKFTVYFVKKDAGLYVEDSVDIECEIPDGTADRESCFCQDATGTSLTGHTIGDQIITRVKRIAATTGTEFASEVFVLQLGLHIECDTMGSRLMATE